MYHYFTMFIILLWQHVFWSKCHTNKASQIQSKIEIVSFLGFMHVCTQVGVPLLWIYACLQRRRMLMLTVTLSHVPEIFTLALEDSTSFFPTTLRSHICTISVCSSYLLKCHYNNFCHVALTRLNTFVWHIPSHYCAILNVFQKTAILSNYLVHRS